ncbi:hypothetical protein HGRIS_003243 [Hohenbuehelia grisea]|uniref:Uncharacterized protein n=1 Tax=Hohenbuehelia grisea TaxID=104357 RepID=A0ABR3JN41_9AGAR
MLIEDTKISLPYTIIQVGGWYEFGFPPLSEQASNNGKLYTVYGGGETKTASCDRKSMGRFGARIIDDPTTVGKRVLAHEDEVTQNQLWALADKYAPNRLEGKRVDVTAEDLDRLIHESAEGKDLPGLVWNQYMKSVYVSGHNSVAEAKKDGWIIARDIYHDLPVRTAEEWAKETYST